MKVSVVNEAGGKAKGEIEVSDKAFAVDFNESLVHQVVVAYQATGRSGTRAQKNRSAVRGSTSKPWNQKGTGQARAGSIRSPLWRGGGRVFPSSPLENFTQKVNKKMHRAGLRSIMSELVRQERLLAVESFQVDSPKTKLLLEKLNKMGVMDVLIVTDSVNDNLRLSARNLHRVEVCDVQHVDPVSLVRHEKVIITVPALKRFEEMLG